MIIRRMRRIFSSVVLAIYLMIYAAPLGLCVEASPVMKGNVNKPVLRSAAAPAVVKPGSLKLEGEINISKGNPKVNLSLRDSDVKQVLRMFADKAGLNIVFHSSVDGKVTLDLVNMPLNDAFKLVMQISNLTYYVDHNTMVVASSAAATGLNLAKQEMTTIPVKYADASVLANFLNKNIYAMNKPGLSNAEIAVTNPGSNEILIFGTENDYRMAKKIVERFDLKPVSNTYVVNHTTPKEMADLLCTVLFPPVAGSGGSSGGGSSSSPAASSAPAPSSTGAPTPAPSGSPTGGAGPVTLGAGTVACSYANAVTAGSLASVGLKSMTISYFPQHGTIEVSGGSPQQQELIKEFIAKNDKKQPQAYLEVSLIELSESGSQSFQNTWRYWSESFSANFDGGKLASNDYYPTFFQGDQYTIVSGTTSTTIRKFAGTPTLTYAINYLVDNKKGRVLANPRILITNGENSVIDLTSDYVKSVTSQVVTSGTSMIPTIQRTFTIANDDGIKVDMTPFISPEGYVTLNITPVYASIKEKIYTTAATGSGQDLGATLLQRRNLDLKNVRIKDGETLVIGGMIREDEQKTVSKIPFLGDLPGVGFFFRNSDTTKVKSELVIMITPKIIKDAEDVVNNTDATL